MKESPSLKNQAKAIFIGNILATLFQLLTPVIITRLVAKADYGIFRQFTLIAIPLFTMLGMGYSTSLYYFYPTSDAKGKQKIIQQTQFLFLINAFITLLIFTIFGDEIFEYFKFDKSAGIEMYLVLYISFELLASIIENIFTLEKNLLLNKVYYPLEKIGRFLIFLITVLILPGYKGLITALTIFGALKFLFLAQHISPYFKKIYKLDFKLIKEQLIYSIPFGLAIILDVVSNTFDKFIINKYISAEEFAVYAVSFVSIPILAHFFKSIHNVVVPEISIHLSNNRMKEATVLWQKTVEKTSSLTIPSVFIFWLMAHEIIGVMYPPEYSEAANYYRIYIIMFFASMFSHNIILRGAKKTHLILVGSVIGVIITVILGLILVPIYGLYGAVVTGLIGVTTPILISINIERRVMRLSFSNWVNWKKLGINFAICFLASLPIYFFKDYIPNVFVRGTVSGIVFVLIVVPLQIKYDIFLFNDMLVKVLKKININIGEK